MDSLFASTQHDGIAGFEGQRDSVDGNVGPRFVDDAHDPKRHPDLADTKSIRAHPFPQDLESWIGELGHVAHACGHQANAVGIQQKTIAHGTGEPRRFQIFAIGFNNVFDIRFQGASHVYEEGVLLSRGKLCQPRGSPACAQKLVAGGESSSHNGCHRLKKLAFNEAPRCGAMNRFLWTDTSLSDGRNAADMNPGTAY